LPITNEIATGGDRLDNSIKLWSLNPQDFALCTRKLNGHTSGINCLLLIPNTCILISGSQDYTIKVWDLLRGQILNTLLGHTGWIQNLLYLPKHHMLRSSDAYGIDYDQIKFWNIDTGECLKSCRVNRRDSESCTALLSNGILVFGCTDWKIYLNDGDKILNVLEGHQWSILCLLILPNGNLVSGSADKTIRIWDLADLNNTKCLKILRGHRGKQYNE
jgi:WD40 repeat protein